VPKNKETQPLAAEVWRILFDFIVATRDQRVRALARYALTPNDSRALFALDAEGRTMRSLAEEWECDASNATFIVDRLEARGLVKRRSLERDRRVKLVALTARGTRTRLALAEEMYRPPPELTALGQRDLERLLAAVQKLSPR